MATQCHNQLTLGFQPKIVLDFNGGQITSDSGLLLLRQFDEQRALTKKLRGLLNDWRHPGFIEHSTDQMLCQRIYQIAAGYEDCDDADRLRTDPTFQSVVGKADPLASQLTLSRLENHADWQSIRRLSQLCLSGLSSMVTTSEKLPEKFYWTQTPPTIRATASKGSPFFTANMASTGIIRCISSKPKPVVCSRHDFAPAMPRLQRPPALSLNAWCRSLGGVLLKARSASAPMPARPRQPSMRAWNRSRFFMPWVSAPMRCFNEEPSAG